VKGQISSLKAELKPVRLPSDPVIEISMFSWKRKIVNILLKIFYFIYVISST
jgi:hypothetical protein